jgi:uncharacterized surface protein with fasciclin (FAS1) repeats
MPAPARLPSPRYRRRILGAGLIAAGALFSLGAPVYVGRIEDDLEQRLPEELAEAGFADVAAEFEGQDGTIHCAQPLDDPQAAIDAAYDVWGVRSVEVARSCRVNTGSSVDSSAGAAAPLASNVAGADATGSAPAAAPDSIAEVVAADPRLSYLSMLLTESGVLTALSAGTDQVTLFAPTDDAFEQLSPDANARFRSDPDLLMRVLRHHITTGSLAVEDLKPGPLVMIDRSRVDVSVDGAAVRIGEANVIDADLTTGDRVVHVIDQVLIPEDVEIGSLNTTG